MKIHSDIFQGSLDWIKLRFGKVTASELDNLVTPEFKLRTGEMPYTYLCTKVAEALHGPLPGFDVFDTEQGRILEEEAIPFFELTYNRDIRRVGFIENDPATAGCSPDGLLGEDNGIEIKCPSAQVHVKYLLKGTVPKDYLAQVHCSMFVTGFPRWTFFSYRRKFPPLVITVERDEEIISKIGVAVSTFRASFDEAMESIRGMAKAA